MKSHFPLLGVQRESLQEAVHRRNGDHCAPMPHASQSKIGGELVKNINKRKKIQKDRKEVRIKQKLETGVS